MVINYKLEVVILACFIYLPVSVRVCVCMCVYVSMHVSMRIQVLWYMHKKRGEKEFLAPGLLLGSYISRKNAVDGRMLVIAHASPNAQTSLRWLIIHIFPRREGNIIPWRSLYGCFV